jgi:hypothetical protein
MEVTMSPAALSVFVFGIYLAAAGIGFLFVPNTVLPMFKFPKTNEPWVRIMGFLIVLIGFYYIVAARNELNVFFWATVIGRFSVLICFIALVVTKKAQPMLIAFGVIDSAGALWTVLAM